MRRTILVPGLVLLVMPVLPACGDDEGPRDQDLARNREVLATLPEFPRARRTGADSAPFYDEGDETPRGYTSAHIYRAPAGTEDQEVIQFYRSHLGPRWRCEVERSQVLDLDHPRRKEPPLLALVCRRHTESLVVNTDSMPQFDVTVGPER